MKLPIDPFHTGHLCIHFLLKIQNLWTVKALKIQSNKSKSNIMRVLGLKSVVWGLKVIILAKLLDIDEWQI